jgi:universal stress protein A
VLEIKRILAPTDFSPHAEVALRFACSLAERLGSTLHLLHVLPEVVPVGPDPMLAPSLPPEYYTETETQSLDALSKAIPPTWAHAPELEVAVRWGGAVEGIVGYATDLSIDLIVISTHGRTGLKHVLLGSVAERIVREAPCPVLTIRDKTN